jgi:phenylacetate-coenzyme A ligase PaaK-like adenylate-forming protein
MAGYEELRKRHVADAARLMPEMLARIEWPVERIAEHRQAELRHLVKVARDLSPWHRKRLNGVDLDTLDEAALAELPSMTKHDVMEHWDEIATDDRLRLDVAEDHLDRLTSDAYLLDRYHVVTTGGSTGRPGVFVYDWDAWTIVYASITRFEVRARQRDAALAAAPPVFAAVLAGSTRHIGSSIFQTFSNADATWHRFPVTLPATEIVAGLNAAQPTVLVGYASALYPLVHEAEAGRLRIAPRRIQSIGEPLLPEIRAALERAWGVPVVNVWGCSEGGTGGACGESAGLHLSDDLVIIEPVDADGQPVGVGERSSKILITNLFNHALPLIRYELTDELTVLDEPCPCGSRFTRIGDPHGRLDDTFTYGDGLVVHPHNFRSPLSHYAGIVEYQVRQTGRGAAVAVRVTAPLDEAGLAAELTTGLARLGLTDPEVTVTTVEHLDRQYSGKLKRFVPLSR